MSAYLGILESWRDGVYDCRHLNYQHPWLVVHRQSGTVEGHWSREECRQQLRRLRRIHWSNENSVRSEEY